MSTERRCEPTIITKGERVEWTRSFDDYSAADYDLEYRIRGAAGPGVNITATAAAMTVTGIGAGDYRMTGIGGSGKPYYNLVGSGSTAEDGAAISNGGSTWQMYNIEGSLINESLDNTATPDLATWTGSTVTAADDFDAVLSAAQSATLAAGEWYWQAWLTDKSDATNTFVVAEGRFTVKPGFSTSPTSAVDMRSPAKIALDSIDAAMAAFAESDVQEYEISTPAGSRRVKRAARKDLMDMRRMYAAIVAREIQKERLRSGRPFGRTVKARIYES